MMKRKLTSILSAAALIAGLASCDSYLDINTDPNSPAEGNIEVGMMMPAVEMNLASSYGNFLRICGGYYAEAYGHLAGTSNYLDYSQFTMSATRSSGTYTQLTQRVLLNLKTVREKSEAAEDWGTYLAATVLRGFAYQAMVDCYGEIPYTEALDPSNLAPKYDDGKVVYEGVLAELDEALAKASATSTVCTNFLYPGKPAASWIQFANALKLRMLMRMADVKDVKAEVGALIAENNFPAADVQFAGCWANETGKLSPFYAEEFSTAWGSNQINVAANLAIIATMQVKDADGNVVYTDPRLPKYFDKNENGEYVGSVSGTNYKSPSDLRFNRPVANWDMPVSLISVAEVEFLKAEYYARYGSAADAEASYVAAIEASFAAVGVEGVDDYLARNPYDNTNYKRCLGIAKWVHLSGVNPYEAWCEMRRLDYPTFGSKKGSDFYDPGDGDASYKVNDYVAGTLYTPIQVFGQVGDNKILERFPYPESSSSRNSNVPAFPGYTAPVFWAK